MSLNNKLLEFQKELLTISKDSTNPHFKSSYASLPHILEGVTPALNKLKLVVTNYISDTNVVTQVTDQETGEALQSSFPVFGNKPQEIGSSITYARRYNIGCLLNLNIDGDDDGNNANEAKRTYTELGEYDGGKWQTPSNPQENKLKEIIDDIQLASSLEKLEELYLEGKKYARTDKQKGWLNRETSAIKQSLTP